jgi:phytol kinase
MRLVHRRARPGDSVCFVWPALGTLRRYLDVAQHPTNATQTIAVWRRRCWGSCCFQPDNRGQVPRNAQRHCTRGGQDNETRSRFTGWHAHELEVKGSVWQRRLPSVGVFASRDASRWRQYLETLGAALVGTLSAPCYASGSTVARESLQVVHGNALVTRDLAAAVFALIGSYAWLKIWDWLATNGYIESTLSRKIVHITSVPLFMLSWPLFAENHVAAGAVPAGVSLQSWSTFLSMAARSSQGIAAMVPAILSVRLLLAGLGLSQDTLVNALARQKAAMQKWIREHADEDGASEQSMTANASMLVQGDRSEALKGPLYYCLATTVCTFLFWRGPSPVGILALIQMCVGDGMADLIGRRWRTPKWPLPRGGGSQKTIGGTTVFIVSAFLVSCLYIAIFHAWGYVDIGIAAAAARIAMLTVCCAVVELVAPGDDNITVPLSACLIGSLLFPGS